VSSANAQTFVEARKERFKTMMPTYTNKSRLVTSGFLFATISLVTMDYTSLSKLNVAKLKEKCKELKITGYSKLSKPLLIERLLCVPL
jgi:hypothetical protein